MSILFFVGCFFSASPWCSPPLALILGAALALTLGNPFPAASKKVSRVLLQAAVVLLGFAMDLRQVLEAGERGLLFALVSISSVFLLGWALQRLLNVRPITSLLVSTGTAICGGSAIAAMATVVDAPQEDVSVAIGTVFLLNAIALIVFPGLGHLMGMAPEQFGVWAGIAIHDVSSVVGAGKVYGGAALGVATAVKLSRVLYLIPITLIASYFYAKSARAEGNASVKLPIPWFIGLFLLASLARTYSPAIQHLAEPIKFVAGGGFALSLFLIGLGLTLETLKKVGIRPLVQGVALWLFISVAALFAARDLA